MTDNAALENALQATLDRIVENRLSKLRQELSRELQVEIAKALGQAPGGAAPRAGTAGGGSVTALHQSMARILKPTGQTDVMGACLESATGFAGRCAFFVRRGEAFAFWRADGFLAEASGKLRGLSMPLSQPGLFKDMNDSLRAVTRDRSSRALPENWEKALGDATEATFHLFPVVVQGRAVAALYADSGTSAGSVEPEALEILARVTGLSLETMAGRAAGRPAQPTEAPATTASQAETAAPATEVQEAVPADAGSSSPPPGAFAASVTAASEGAPTVEPPPTPESLPEEDRDVHRKAHRFARVAVQDLLSYHKDKIAQGRQEKNLYELLKIDIDKTRENYQQRFGQTAARSFDYFHYELVMKLAGNDASTLGAHYPGPKV